MNIPSSIADRRKLAYYFYEFDDRNLQSIKIKNFTDQELSDMIVEFFLSESKLIYPTKSYFVALVYAYCMEKYFGIDFYEALSSEDLLVEDKYFIPYNYLTKIIYNNVLSRIDLSKEYLSMQKTMQYFRQEFLVGKSVPLLTEGNHGTDNKANIKMQLQL